jgi:hypothetical protein
MTRVGFGAGVLGALLVAGCGGGGSSPAGNGPGISWQDDGVTTTALGLKAIFSTGMGSDGLEIIGLGQSVKTGVAVAVAATTPLTPQTFVCHQTTAGQSVTVTYNDADGGSELSTASCTVVLTQVGAVGGPSAIGTFEAVFNLRAGGTKTLSNGRFDLPLRQ